MTQARAEERPSVFAEWAGVTTAHGFFDFAQAKTIVGKVIWFVLIFISLVLMCYQVQRGIRDFASHEWKTTVQGARSKDEGGVPFPSIVACNINRLKYSKVKEYNMTLDMVRYFFMTMIPFNKYLINSVDKTVEQEFTKWRKLHNFSRIEDIFEKMTSATNMVNLFGPPDEESSSYVVVPEYGICTQISYNFNSTKAGSQGGKLLIFNTERWDYLPVVENNYISEGIVIQATYGYADVGKWIFMSPGTYVALGMQVVEENLRETDNSLFNPFALFNPDPPCERAPTLKFATEPTYSVSYCEVECSLLISIHLCNCTPFTTTENYRECEIEEYLTCYGVNDSFVDVKTSAVSYFIPEEVKNAVTECERNCAKPCYSRYVESTISSTNYPGEVQNEALRKWLSGRGSSNMRTNDTIVLEIYFNTLETKTMELYEVMSFDSLISNAGGLIGLWAGMSFLTIFQAISYFIKYIEQRYMANKVSKI